MRPCPNPNDTGDGLDHTDDVGETDCPAASWWTDTDDPGHCEHWYDGDQCCRCGAPGLPECPTCHGAGEVPDRWWRRAWRYVAAGYGPRRDELVK